MSFLASFGVQWADRAFGILAPLLTSTPALWTLPVVVTLWRVMLSLGGALTLVMVVLAGGRHMAGEESVARGVLAPLVLSVLIMLLSQRVAAFLIHLNNAIIQTIGKDSVDSRLQVPTVVQVENDLLVWLPYIVLLLGLSLVYLVRAAEIMFLIAISPLGLAALVWPMSRGLGIRFLQELVVIVFVQSVQAVILVLSRGLSGLEVPGGPYNPFVGLIVLYVLIRAPSYLRRLVSPAPSVSGFPWLFMRLFNS